MRLFGSSPIFATSTIFACPETPRALELPAGMGVRLRRDMASAVIELHAAMRGAFDSEEYRTRKQRLLEQFGARQEAALEELRTRAAQRDIAVKHSSTGIEIAPIFGGSTLDPERFRKLPEADQQRLQGEMERIGQELVTLFQRFHDWAHEQQEAIKALDAELAAAATRRVLEAVRRGYAELPEVLAYLSQVEADMAASADQFLAELPAGLENALRRALAQEHGDGLAMRRYQVNVLVASEEQPSGPVVYEDHPTHANLVGRIDHEAQFGALTTNFTLIKAGAFHRARGGYLLLDAVKLLQQPFAWEAVKRTIRSGEIRIEPLGEAIGLPSTVSLRPAPFLLGDTKVVRSAQFLRDVCIIRARPCGSQSAPHFEGGIARAPPAGASGDLPSPLTKSSETMSVPSEPTWPTFGAHVERRLSSLLDAAPDATLIVDGLGKILIANTLAEALFGYESGGLVGRDLEDLIPERFRAGHRRSREEFARAPRSLGMGSGMRLYGLRRDGSEFPAEVSLNPFRSEGGAPWIVAGVRDIAERLKQEQVAHQNERMAESVQLKAAFFAHMSHELRTPLNAVIGFAEVLHDELAGPLNEQQKNFLNNILSGARHLHGLIDGMLDLARMQAGKMDFHASIFELRALMAEVCDGLRLLAARKRITLELRVDPALDSASLDTLRLKQVLINLVGNAIKFTPPGGAVSVRALPDGEDRFRIEVEDTGPGIPADQLGKLFVEFQQLEHGVRCGQEGMGLGLALSKRIVEAQGGSVGVTSTPGRGSVFYAVLPLRHEPQRATSASTSSLSRPKRSTS